MCNSGAFLTVCGNIDTTFLYEKKDEKTDFPIAC